MEFKTKFNNPRNIDMILFYETQVNSIFHLKILNYYTYCQYCLTRPITSVSRDNKTVVLKQIIHH